MKTTPMSVPEVLLVEPQRFGDARGYFVETWREERYAAVGIDMHFVQDNLSRSTRGILRGLHLQHPNDQGKLVYVLEGEVFDVAVDVRVGSPNFGKWTGALLSATDHRQLWIPPGFAHGFCVTSETALFAYKCTAAYAAANELGLAWNDPAIGIPWPVADPQLSAKDKILPRLSEIDPARLPRYRG
ncbi:MAG TPA: dTDP-4-dehydrorhamnose 3,5-epimerase [Polyangia bacterium]